MMIIKFRGTKLNIVETFLDLIFFVSQNNLHKSLMTRKENSSESFGISRHTFQEHKKRGS